MDHHPLAKKGPARVLVGMRTSRETPILAVDVETWRPSGRCFVTCSYKVPSHVRVYATWLLPKAVLALGDSVSGSS